jgi:hypothetical protein
MRKIIGASVVASIAMAATLAFGAAAFASTTDVLTYGSAGGTNVSAGDTLSTGLSSGTNATFFTAKTGSTGVTCTSAAMSSGVTSNPAAGGKAGLSVSSTSYSGCSNTEGYGLVGVTINSYTASISSTSSTTGSVTGNVTFSIPRSGLGAQTCLYAGSSLTGTNVFTNQPLSLTGGSVSGHAGTDDANCPSTLYYSATFGTTKDTSVTGAPSVFVNS